MYQALTEALKWKAQGSPPTDHDGEEFTFEDDGNSLRVRSSKREFVQISKVRRFPKKHGFCIDFDSRLRNMRNLSSYGYLTPRLF